MNLEIIIALAVLVVLGGGLFFYKKKAKDKAKRTIPPSSNLPAGKPWEGHTAHKRWTEEGGEDHFDHERTMSMSEDAWLTLCEIMEEVRGAHAFEDNPVAGDWWGVHGFDCKAFARTFKLDCEVYFPKGSARLATCKTSKFYHAVCLVYTNRGVYVLDNLHSKPVPWDKVDYTEFAIETTNGEWKRL